MKLPWEAFTVKIKSDNSKLRKNYWRYCLALKATFFTLYLSNLNSEGEVSRSKIDRFMAHCFSKLKWAWRAYFLSNAPIFYKNAQLLKMYK